MSLDAAAVDGGPMRSRRLLAALVIGLASVALLAPPTPAQTAPPTLELDPSSGPAGTTVEAQGIGYPGGFQASLHLDRVDGPRLVDEVPIARDRTFDARFVVPRGTPAGRHPIFVCYRRSPSAPEACDDTSPASFRVTVAPPTTRPPVVTVPPPPSSVGTVPPTPPTAVVGTITTTTTLPDDLGTETTTTVTAPGVGVLTGPPTTHGLGLGDLAGISDLPDLSITGMEITQGIQNTDNDMPLVEHRTTTLRVFVQTDGEEMPHVSGVLQLVRNGSTEVAVLEPDNGPLTVEGGPPDRLDPDASLNFTLPPEATGRTSTGDRLIATAFVFGTHPTTPALYEPTDVNNYEAEVFDFHRVGHLTVHLSKMHTHWAPTPLAPEATVGTDPLDLFRVAATITALYRYHPVAGIDVEWEPTIYPPLHGAPVPWILWPLTEWDLTQDGVEGSILAEVQELWAETSSTSHLDQYYGIYREEVPREWGGFSNGTVAYGYVTLATGNLHTWYQGGGWLAAHELGHSIGFPHVDCKGSEGNPGPYPYDDPCALGPTSGDLYYGWDIRHQAFTNTGPVVIAPGPGLHPHFGYPYMGYQSSKWADPWHYCRALDRFGVNCTALSIPENQVDPPDGPGLTTEAPYLPVEGQDGWLRFNAFLDGPDSVLLDAEVVPEPLPHVLPEMARRRSLGTPTGITAVLVDGDGTVVDELELVDTMDGADRRGPDGEDLEHEPADGEGALVLGQDYLHWQSHLGGGAAALQLRVGDEVVASRPISPSAPTVEVLAPLAGEVLAAPFDIGWSAEDADGDPLAFDIAYSPDGGDTWQALANLVGGSSYTVEDLSVLGGGDQAIFRVTARDGIHATSAASAPAVVPDQPPTVVLLSPGDGVTVPLHGTLTLLAAASDHEDGTEDGPEVTWTSDRDGVIGSGEEVTTQALSAGEHEVTATATDSSGGMASASVTIVVDEASAIPRLDAEGFEAALAALADGPTDGGDDTSRVLLWVGGGLTVAAALGLGVALRRGRALRLTPPPA